MSGKNKKVLIIAYYWPPSGGSGVQRWLKFVKYLPQFGYKPYVFTPENPSYDIQDKSLLEDVPAEAEIIRYPIWEPYKAFFIISKIFGKQQTAKPTELVSSSKRSLLQTISTWVRGNLFIPDPRIFWVKPSANFLENFVREKEIEIIITTGPPHSIHLIGLKLKKKLPSLRWLADFRDPWSEWGLLDTLMTGKRARKKHKKLERKVLNHADEIITITPFYKRRFEALSNRNVNLLTNGFDEDDFSTTEPIKTNEFILRHVGIVNEKCDPRPFMEAVKMLAAEDSGFLNATKIEFIGEVHPQFRQYVNESAVLNRMITFEGNIPHNELLKLYLRSSVLLLILTGYKDAEGYMPGKLFEYLATGLPILGVGPANGDAANLLKETGIGHMIEGQEVVKIKECLRDYFYQWKSGALSRIQKNKANQYSRKEITARLIKILDQDNP